MLAETGGKVKKKKNQTLNGDDKKNEEELICWVFTAVRDLEAEYNPTINRKDGRQR